MLPNLAGTLALAARCVPFRHTRKNRPVRAQRTRLGGELLEMRLTLSGSGVASLSGHAALVPALHATVQLPDHSTSVTTDTSKHGGADDPANHDAAADHGQRHGGHGADDGAAVTTTDRSKHDGTDDPANHDAADDHGQRHGGHGTDDGTTVTATNMSNHDGVDDSANHDALDNQGQPHDGHGADDLVAATPTDTTKHGGADDPATHDASDNQGIDGRKGHGR